MWGGTMRKWRKFEGAASEATEGRETVEQQGHLSLQTASRPSKFTVSTEVSRNDAHIVSR